MSEEQKELISAEVRYAIEKEVRSSIHFHACTTAQMESGNLMVCGHEGEGVRAFQLSPKTLEKLTPYRVRFMLEQDLIYERDQ